VKGSTTKGDGVYKRMSERCRGRPAYEMAAAADDKKAMYLYSVSGKWMVGTDLGSKKCYARVKDFGLPHPCEPYPASWEAVVKKAKEVKEKDDKKREYQKVIGMRVIRTDAGEQTEPLQLDEGASRKRGVKRKSGATRPEVNGTVAADSSSPAPAAPVAGEDELGPEEDDEEETSEEEEEQQAPAVSSDSDSDSEASSSSDSASEPAKAAPAPAVDSKPAQGTNSQSPQDMAELRRVRIMGQLKNVTDPKEKLKMIQLVKDNYVKRQNGATPESEEAAKAVYAMLAAMMKEYMPKGGPPPKGPPPARLLEKMEAGAARSPRTQGEASGKGMQLTSSLALHRDNEELHNIPPPTRSALKRKGAPPLENNVRIQWQNMQIDPAADPVAARYEVKSYKMNSELWFQMPGAHVTCDKCENSVPQSMGQLQGVQDGSQFAQNAFYCNDCLRNGIGD